MNQQRIHISGQCFEEILAHEGKWCGDWIELDRYMNICDGSTYDCVSKGKHLCSSDPTCFGITYPLELNWLQNKKGVAICTSQTIVAKPEKDWNVYLKCDEGKF